MSDVREVNIGGAWLAFRCCTREDILEVASDLLQEERREIVAQCDPRHLSGAIAGEALVLQKLAERCFVEWSPGFLEDEVIDALIGPHKKSDVGGLLRDLLVHRIVGQLIVAAITPPDDAPEPFIIN